MPGSPSVAELKTMLQNFVDAREDARAWFDGTYIGLLDTIEQALEGDYIVSGGAEFTAAARGAASGVLSLDGIWLRSWFAEFGKAIASPASPSDVTRLVQDAYQYFVDNSEAVTSRQITYSTPSAAGGNTGDGLMSRLTADENGYNLEAVTVEAKTAKVRQDQTTGARRGEEIWELYGVEPSPDALGRTSGGSGVSATLVTQNGGNSLLTNSSFDEEHGTTDSDTDKVSGWEITSGATAIEEALGSSSANNIFIEAPGVTTANSRSLQFDGNGAIRQKLSSAGISLDPATPYFLRVMVRRQNSCDGTLTIAMGSTTAAVDLTTHTNDTWEELVVTPGQSSWPSQFYEDECDISITLASNTTGDVLIDDVIFAPFTQVDGSYYLIRTGATPWTLDDKFTFTDSGGAPTTAKIQYALQVNGFGYLPSGTGSTVTWADP